MIAPWLKRHLGEIGAWNSDGVSRRARVRRHSCGRYVVVGLDAHVCAGVAIVDTDVLTPLGEALATLAGRGTYTLRDVVGRLEIDRRSQFHIAGSPAGTTRYDTVPEHRCLDRSLELFTAPTTHRPPAAAVDYDAPPPF